MPHVRARFWVPILLWLLAGGTPLPGETVFVDVTDAAGVSYLQHEPRGILDCFLVVSCEPEAMSGGAAVADVDGDGWLDLFVTRLDGHDLLFRNLGDGTFEEISQPAGLSEFDLQSNGAAFADLDNDGDPDLIVTVLGDPGASPNDRNYLFINDGTGVFSEEALSRGAADVAPERQRLTYGIAVGDYDRDGWLDLHITEWMPLTPSHSSLLRNLGPEAPGHFENMTAVAGVGLSDSFGFASALTDLDGDGHPDLAVAGDFGTSRLFWNRGDGTFEDGTAVSGIGTDENGMGSTIGDFDGDGDLDWFVTSIFDPSQGGDPAGNWGASGNRLYRNEGGRVFSDATDEAGVREGGWGWGAAFLDFDNDRDLDLVMTNGVDFPQTAFDALFNEDPMRLWVNDGGGVFSEEAAAHGLTDTASGKGLLVFDYDDDGDLDLFLVNNAAAPRLYRNDGGNAGGWLRVRTIGTDSSRDALGARVILREAGWPDQVREIGSVSHFLGGSDPAAHFGLADGEGDVHLTIRWPSGRNQELPNVPRDRVVTVEEGVCLDLDGDGACGDVDCDDADPGIGPGFPDLPGNSLDEDCDGEPVCDPAADWHNQGRFVSCVARECAALVRDGVLSGKDCANLIGAL